MRYRLGASRRIAGMLERDRTPPHQFGKCPPAEPEGGQPSDLYVITGRTLYVITGRTPLSGGDGWAAAGRLADPDQRR